jgi:hypothetical protein
VDSLAARGKAPDHRSEDKMTGPQNLLSSPARESADAA